MIHDSLEFYDIFKSRCFDMENKKFSMCHQLYSKKKLKIKLDRRIINYFNQFGKQSKSHIEKVLLDYVENTDVDEAN